MEREGARERDGQTYSYREGGGVTRKERERERDRRTDILVERGGGVQGKRGSEKEKDRHTEREIRGSDSERRRKREV